MNWKNDHWSKENYQDFKNHLLQIAEEEYRKFNEKIIPCDHPILGIRMPVLRKLAKDIAKGMGVEFLEVDVTAFREKVLPLHKEILNENPKLRPIYDAIQKEAGSND